MTDDVKPEDVKKLVTIFNDFEVMTDNTVNKIKRNFGKGSNALRDIIDDIDAIDEFASGFVKRTGIKEQIAINQLSAVSEKLAEALGRKRPLDVEQVKIEKPEDEHFLISFPIDGITTTLEAGDTYIDFYEGEVRENGKDVQYLSKKLEGTSRDAIYSLYINSDKEIKVKINTNDVISTNGKFYISGTAITTIHITTTEDTVITIIGSTNSDTDVKSSDGTSSSSPIIYNIKMDNVDTEYSQILADGTKKLEIKCRELKELRFAFESGKVAGSDNPYSTLSADETIWEDDLNLNNTIIYLACSIAGQTAEVKVWT